MANKLYSTDREITRKRGIHTVYIGNGEPIASKEHRVKGITFGNGITRDLEGQDANNLIDLGHASRSRITEEE